MGPRLRGSGLQDHAAGKDRPLRAVGLGAGTVHRLKQSMA